MMEDLLNILSHEAERKSFAYNIRHIQTTITCVKQ